MYGMDALRASGRWLTGSLEDDGWDRHFGTSIIIVMHSIVILTNHS